MIKNKETTKDENLQSNLMTVIEEREVLDRKFKIYGTLENPMFLAKDVANWIEHSNSRMMLKKIDEEEKVVNIVYTLGGIQEQWFLTEDGLYEVLMQSRKPIAKEFKNKVKQILKEIRLRGMYLTNSKLNEALEDKEKFIKEIEDLKQERELLLENKFTKEDVKFMLEDFRENLLEELRTSKILENTLTREQRFQRCIDKIQLYTKKAGSNNYYFLCSFLMNFFGIDDSKRPYNMTRRDHIFSYILIEDIEKAVEQLINGQIKVSLNGDYYSLNIFNWKHEEEKLWKHYKVPNNSVFGAKEELYGCYLCGQVFEVQNMCIEHKLAKVKGGDNSLRNLAVSCKSCNCEKGHEKTVEEMWQLKGQSENHALKCHVLSFYN